ncbi:hypothetical protein [Pseudodesulfovibrio senegalensis]|uniref:Peptidase C39-like domain-containing protein n=1 Tax=Pseudodesulfovibrio senegalensis TaxID=1721087 RepID=A0A6N6N0G1_9BACT|nr:hypothetical protein [Pseudodesulfovibrio senegalensis]KAB1441377.1 hypothetical protein F8A88_10545 [Pseudodesulfovibrio senegalensis]
MGSTRDIGRFRPHRVWLGQMACALLLCLILAAPNGAQAEMVQHNAYFATQTTTASNGAIIEEAVINGPPTPPEGFVRMEANMAAATENAAITVLNEVPAFTWCFGCSATSAAMMAGHLDRTGYPNLYTGPTNNGVMVLNNDDHWSTWTDPGGDTRNRCPLSATQQGLDGRTTRGGVDDYWYQYNSSIDPFTEGGGWTEHTLGGSTGDYMRTNRYAAPSQNTDGSTTFYNYTNGAVFTAAAAVSNGVTGKSGMYGLKLFFESRGYTVTEAYNQYIYGYNGNTQGFTFDDFKAVIDSGFPLLVQVQGHTMLGLGYNADTEDIYIHDTWDHTTHTMPWGGTYSGMDMYAVTVVKLDPDEREATANVIPAANLLLLGQ